MVLLHTWLIDLYLLGVSKHQIAEWIDPNLCVDSGWSHLVILACGYLYFYRSPNRAASRGYFLCRQSDQASEILQQLIHGWIECLRHTKETAQY
jgi:hypothetical protein